ncbi:ankyrin repeat domain-containing protein [Janthinobacterium sp. Mn2066]|uniref:ankyrin repeat domain-containing protein n=1 Tax=Janthinobacterium sp. Mn2066 TaxID=3395264 RepID=UPI003BBA6A60
MLNRALRTAIAATLMVSATVVQAAPDPVSFFRAVSVDNANGVRDMLADGIDPNLISTVYDEPALVLAVRDDADKVFQVLLNTPGINLETPAANGNTALMLAAYRHKQALVEALLAKGAKVNQPGWTALHYAASAGDLPIMKILFDRQAAVDARATTNITPLMFAAREGQEEAVRLLLSWGADPSLKSDHGWTADQFALAADKPRVAAMIKAAQQARAARK